MRFISNLVNNVVSTVAALVDDHREEGQTLVEYALIIALISLVVIALASTMTSAIGDTFQAIADKLNSANS